MNTETVLVVGEKIAPVGQNKKIKMEKEEDQVLPSQKYVPSY